MHGNLLENSVTYRAVASDRHNPFAYPIHSIELTPRKRCDALVIVIFRVEHVFLDRLSVFLKSMSPQLEHACLTANPALEYSEETHFGEEGLVCRMQYSGNEVFTNIQAVGVFICRLASLLGSPSVGRPHAFGRVLPSSPYCYVVSPPQGRRVCE